MPEGIDYCKTCYHPKADHLFNGFDANASCGLQECECVDFVLGETRVTASTGASKGTKEERFDLIPIPALTYLARLYGKGAIKYAEHNWRLGYDWSKSYAAAQRHMNAFWAGEDIDPETQVPHVINAAFHMFALATYITEHPEFDDRFETRESRSDDDLKYTDIPGAGDLNMTVIQPVALDAAEIYRKIQEYAIAGVDTRKLVIPEAPIRTSSKRIKIPATEGVAYIREGIVVSSSIHKGLGLCLIEAVPLPGYVFPTMADKDWTFTDGR